MTTSNSRRLPLGEVARSSASNVVEPRVIQHPFRAQVPCGCCCTARARGVAGEVGG